MNKRQKFFREYLKRETARWPRRYIRQMFGSAGFFYGPKLFAFIAQQSFGIKLGEKERKAALQLRGTRPFMISGRPFGRWIEIPFSFAGKDAGKMMPYFRKAYLAARRKAKSG